ncbi:MAG: 3-hydroxybutyrate dehydrogenase [Anaeromyxobacteraceae bacterium]|nr:3-hydroxybutyrate dehydrogenase [Anaeromyxobacteraceae bacterium]
MASSFDGKVAFVTGAAGGIGFRIAEMLAAGGARVTVADLDGEAARAAAERIGRGASGVAADVGNEAAIQAALEATLQSNGRIDLLVNNAGLQHVSPVEDFPSAKFELLVRVMLFGPFYAIKKVFPAMKRQGYGRILNVASINGLVGFAGKAAYNSAKHGVIGLTKVTALEGAAHGITVNALAPGYVDTPLVRNQLADLARTRNVPLEKVLEEVIYPLVPMRRLLQVDEIVGYALFLLSDAAAGITGSVAVMDGGYTAQ